MFQKAFLIALFTLTICGLSAQDYVQYSPDKNIKVEVFIDDEISMNVAFKEKVIISGMKLGLDISPIALVIKKDQIKTDILSMNFDIQDPVSVKFSKSTLAFNELNLILNEHFTLQLRAMNDGIAYRWFLSYEGQSEIKNEKMQFQLESTDISYFPKEDRMISHFERLYLKKDLDSIPPHDFCSLPVLFQKENGVNILITDADLYDYPAMFIEKANKSTGFQAIFPKYIEEIKPAERNPDRNEVIVKEANCIAKVSGNRSLPWRVFAIAENDVDLAKNNLVFQLSSPLKLENTDWIKPGKVAWDWWNANNIYGVDFESGINNKTYEYYIDFASKFGLEYIILDEGWSLTTEDIMHCQSDIDVQHLVNYGKEKGVGIILWTLWKPLEKNMSEVLDLYQSWGVKGVKVDFMQRADQYMVNYYERVAEEAAKRHLLVDFHGAFKPAGLRRAYPNVINYEGLKGLENAKWSKMMTPTHNLILPFIRMIAGPMDYTPGAMDNAHEENFAIRWTRPMSMGTRCHQVAMYVVYESPLQMLCDNPSNYYREKETTAFISQIPTTWNETIILDAKIGEYILLARRHGNDWYIGGMSVDAKEFDLDLNFLYGKSYEMSIMQDGINADKNAQDYRRKTISVDKFTKMKIKLARGGGYAAILKIK